MLGYKVPIYFYDPIVVSTNDNGDYHSKFGGARRPSADGHFSYGLRNTERPSHFGDGTRMIPIHSKYIVHEYNTGSIRFGIDVR